jgi:hypothetical protein
MKESDADKGVKRLRSEFPGWEKIGTGWEKIGKKSDGTNFAIVAWANKDAVFVIMGGSEKPRFKDEEKFVVGFNGKGGETSAWSEPVMFDTIYDAVEFVIELGRAL